MLQKIQCDNSTEKAWTFLIILYIFCISFAVIFPHFTDRCAVKSLTLRCHKTQIQSMHEALSTHLICIVTAGIHKACAPITNNTQERADFTIVWQVYVKHARPLQMHYEITDITVDGYLWQAGRVIYMQIVSIKNGENIWNAWNARLTSERLHVWIPLAGADGSKFTSDLNPHAIDYYQLK